MSSRGDYETAVQHYRELYKLTCCKLALSTVEAYVTSLEQERDELKKQLEGALAMYDIRLKKFDDLKARLDEEGFQGE